MDVPAEDLALLFRSRHPLVVCETVEETRFESLVRAVSSELGLPVSTWSAASGLSPCHPVDAPRTADLTFALKIIRICKSNGVWLLKDPQPHLENPVALRALRETAQEFAGSGRTLVLVGPLLPRRPELEDVEVRFEFGLLGRPELAKLVGDVARRVPREGRAGRVALSPTETGELVSDLEGLTMFEAERSLARAFGEDGVLDGADLPRIRQTKETLIGAGGMLELVASPEGFDRAPERLFRRAVDRRERVVLGLRSAQPARQPVHDDRMPDAGVAGFQDPVPLVGEGQDLRRNAPHLECREEL